RADAARRPWLGPARGRPALSVTGASRPVGFRPAPVEPQTGRGTELRHSRPAKRGAERRARRANAPGLFPGCGAEPRHEPGARPRLGRDAARGRLLLHPAVAGWSPARGPAALPRAAPRAPTGRADPPGRGGLLTALGRDRAVHASLRRGARR